MAITTSFVATDYTCSPSVEDSNVDCYFIPEASLINEFAARGIPQKKIIS